MKPILILLSCLSVFAGSAQTIAEKLKAAATVFEKDSQVKYATYSIYVADAATGQPVFERNSRTGLATASCLKLVTSATAFEKLGPAFRYKTLLGYTGKIDSGVLNGDLFLTGSGDPTLGSWRWESTKMEEVLNRITDLLSAKKIKKIKGKVYINDAGSQWHNVVPGGWIWEDLGNYYGAPARPFNWHENQYDVTYKTSAVPGTEASIVKREPALPGVVLHNYVTAGPKGSGDRSVIFLPPFSNTGYITGTVPAGENAFTASGAMPNPTTVFMQQLAEKLQNAGIIAGDSIVSLLEAYKLNPRNKTAELETGFPPKKLGRISSPALDSINFWFMRRSINLYGEALLRTFVLKTEEESSELLNYAQSIDSTKAFWKARGIEPAALNIYDGSGLSPQNRVTTEALAKVLLYARNRPWFPAYYNAFPVYNEMKLKSGTIGDVKGFAGYHTSKAGKTYVVAFLVNNYDGKSSDIVTKMYKVLDVLK